MPETNFALSTKIIDDINIIYLHGFLDAHTAPELEATLNNIIKSNHFRIIVNFAELNYISSAGLGVFMAFIEEVRENGGDIKLCSMNPKVFSVFDLLGFPLLFDILVDEQTTIEKFSS